MMLLLSSLSSVTLDDIKFNLLIIKTNTYVTNQGIFFNKPVVPEVLYQLQRYPVLEDYRNVSEQTIKVNDKKIETQQLIITNVKTEVITIKELSKVEKTKTILITGGIVTLVETILFIIYIVLNAK